MCCLHLFLVVSFLLYVFLLPLFPLFSVILFLSFSITPVCPSDCGGDRFGPGCSLQCQCSHQAQCDARNGRCLCPVTWLGPTCTEGTVYTHKHTCMETQTHMHACKHKHKHMRTHKHTATHTHANTNANTHTHTPHTHIALMSE